MGYLERLKIEKNAREKFDKDVERTKHAVVEIESLVSRKFEKRFGDLK